jgi:hypothetical protein
VRDWLGAIDGITDQTMQAVEKTVEGLASEGRITPWPELGQQPLAAHAATVFNRKRQE